MIGSQKPWNPSNLICVRSGGTVKFKDHGTLTIELTYRNQQGKEPRSLMITFRSDLFSLRTAKLALLAFALIGFALDSSPLSADEVFYDDPCRLVDTRNIGGGDPIPNGTEFEFRARGQVGGLHGGTTDCGAPIESSGVIIQVVAVTALGDGHLEVYPWQNRPDPPTARLNYASGQTIGNEIFVKTAQPIVTTDQEITIRPAVSGTHLVVDLVGYTTESNPTFPIVQGRIVEILESFGHTHLIVETVPANNCTDPGTCFEIECSDQPGAGEVCAASTEGGCIEIQGYRRPYSSPQYDTSQRMVATIVRTFPLEDPCPWE